ncbi:MAG: hypothetical protein DME22_14345 [Verrucomicrobia bacterium]|nr:MAG: hypothetical protein DME22_14345 [Verrucomicrobiota bacterium]PYK03177.1 MAG: hypothetical protein DME23_00300 [Verrucomicrobiota bacterium]
MNKTNSGSKMTDGRRSRRSVADGRKPENVVSEVPNFLLKLVDWRRLKSTLTEAMPRYRHD